MNLLVLHTYKKNRCESDRIVLKVCQCSGYEKLIWKISWCAAKANKLQLVWKEQKLWCDKGGKTKRSGLWQYIYIVYIMWHRGLAEQLSLLCDSFVSDRLLDVRNFMINNKKIAEFIFLDVFSSPLAVTVKSRAVDCLG